jgi:hypothetical protein
MPISIFACPEDYRPPHFIRFGGRCVFTMDISGIVEGNEHKLSAERLYNLYPQPWVDFWSSESGSVEP